MWLLLSISAMIFIAGGRIVQKSILNHDKHDPITYAIYFQLFVAILLFPVAIANGFSFPPLEKVGFGLLLTVFLYCFGNILVFHSLKKIPISEFTILVSTTPIWTTLTSSIFLHESTNPTKLLGVLATVCGIIIVFYRGKKFSMDKEHYFTLVGAISFGCATTNDAALLHYFNATTYSFLYFLLPCIALSMIYRKKLRGVSHFVKNGLLKFLAPSIFFAGAALAINTAYKIGGEISQIQTIVQANTILIIIFGIVFLNERERLTQKLIGGAVVFAGILLVRMR